MQSAFSAGPLNVSLPAISAGEPVVGILLGVVVFGDRVQDTPGELAIYAGGLAALVAGVIMVGRAPALSQLRAWTEESIASLPPLPLPHVPTLPLNLPGTALRPVRRRRRPARRPGHRRRDPARDPALGARRPHHPQAQTLPPTLPPGLRPPRISPLSITPRSVHPTRPVQPTRPGQPPAPGIPPAPDSPPLRASRPPRTAPRSGHPPRPGQPPAPDNPPATPQNPVQFSHRVDLDRPVTR